MKKKLNKEEFIKKANQVHNFKYDYSLVKYVNTETKVKVICKKHNTIFISLVSHHLWMNSGCPICGKERRIDILKDNTKSFIQKAILKHKNKYTYLKVEYINSKEKVIITCPLHGDFLQHPFTHIRGNGCSKCGNMGNMYKKEDWIKKGKNRVGKLYIIKCWNENEEFYKIGITFLSTKRRYNGKKAMPYEYQILYEQKSLDLGKLWDLELYLKRNIKKLKINYTPLIKFRGSNLECFKQKEQIMNLIKDYE